MKINKWIVLVVIFFICWLIFNIVIYGFYPVYLTFMPLILFSLGMFGFVLFLEKYKKEKKKGYSWVLPLYTFLVTLGTFLIYLLSIYFLKIFFNLGDLYDGGAVLLFIVPLMVIVYFIWIIISFIMAGSIRPKNI
ncbi:hypothetical protein CL616_00980 [archaeon]|nr:hypothetical protein [archaeon]|tara:strand:- start:27 stop:431 length:405 start_codon:yes stop_codon:yes gene_type:complete